MNLRKVLTRAISGAVYIAIIVALISLGSEGVCVLTSVLGLMAILEFERIGSPNTHVSLLVKFVDVITVLSLILIPTLLSNITLPLFFVALFARFMIVLYSNSKTSLRAMTASCMGYIYIAIPLMTINYCSNLLDNTQNHVHIFQSIGEHYCYPILLMFIFIWINDTGAFLVGSLMGKHKMFERVSPKKTWEGLFGGIGLTLLSAVIMQICGLSTFFCFEYPMWFWIVTAIVVCVFATWGDLVESQIKRNFGIKDSGVIMPGHGGILDRIDSLLFVAPAFYLLIKFYNIF